MKRFALAFTAFAAVSFAGQVQVQLDPNTTKVNWILGDVLHTVEGTFKPKNGTIWFDPATGQAGGTLVVDATSGQSGSNARDSRMHKNILESAKFPEITFVPDKVKGAVNLQGTSDVELHGMFTIHGGTHETTMKVKSTIDHQRVTATIEFPVPYVKWGMKNPSNFLLRVDEVVNIKIQAVGTVTGAE